MLYKVFNNRLYPLCSEFPNLFDLRRVKRGSLGVNSLSFSPVRFNTFQYSRCFIPATTILWNELPSMIVEAVKLLKLKLGANVFLLCVHGLYSTLYPSVFKYFSILLAYCFSFRKFFIFAVCICCYFLIFSMSFSFLTELSSMLGPSGFWHHAVSVGSAVLRVFL